MNFAASCFTFSTSCESSQRFGIALGQQFFEIAFESQVPAVQHERIDVAPHLRQIRDLAHAAVEIGRGGNRNIGANFGAARGAEFDHRRPLPRGGGSARS